MEDAATNLSERYIALLISLALCVFILFIAKKNQFFKIVDEWRYDNNQISTLYVFQAFALFLIFGIFFVPTLIEVWEYYFGNFEDLNIKNGIQNILSSSLTFFSYLFLLKTLSQRNRSTVVGFIGDNSSFSTKFNHYFKGAFSWVIVYPLIVFIGQFISNIVSFFYQGPEVNQVAVDHVQKIISFPALFFVTALFIVTVIPFIEELLFRGFLQGWIKGHLGRFFAIIITSLIFALFHYSASQGVENIELVVSLFVLSCFLGFLKEKYESIWASIGLHSTFNFISLIMISLRL